MWLQGRIYCSIVNVFLFFLFHFQVQLMYHFVIQLTFVQVPSIHHNVSLYPTHLGFRTKELEVNMVIGFSYLNSHLFNKGCVECPLCLRGNVCEDTKHFLMICRLYDNIRTTLLARLQQLNLHVPTNHKLLLYGNTRLTPDTNLLIQEHLSAYLIESKWFLHNHDRQNWILKCLTSTLLLWLLILCPQSFPIPPTLSLIILLCHYTSYLLYFCFTWCTILQCKKISIDIALLPNLVNHVLVLSNYLVNNKYV